MFPGGNFSLGCPHSNMRIERVPVRSFCNIPATHPPDLGNVVSDRRDLPLMDPWKFVEIAVPWNKP
jgi:hypothetical protein